MNFLMQSDAAGGIVFIIIMLFIAVVGLVAFAVWLWSLIDVIKSDFKGPNDKLIWILVVVLGGIIGSVIYFIVGRGNKIS